jgi:hypothetical protein
VHPQEQLNQLLDGCTFMFEQFTYNVAKPAAVSAALEKAGFSEEHVRMCLSPLRRN